MVRYAGLAIAILTVAASLAFAADAPSPGKKMTSAELAQWIDARMAPALIATPASAEPADPDRDAVRR